MTPTVPSGKRVLDTHAVEILTVRKILRQHDAAAEQARGFDDRRVPIRDAMAGRRLESGADEWWR